MKNNRTFLEKLLDGAEVEWKPLIKVASLTRGRVISKEYLANNLGDYPVYSSQTVNNGEIGKINSFDFDGEFVSWTTDGANAGTVFYRSGKFSITNVCGLIKIQNNLELNYKFLFYWLSIEAKNHVYSGMGNPKLMSHQMEKILIPIPPLSVQTEIVKILDALTALTSELTLRRKQYEYYREKLLSEEELGKVGFEWKPLKEIAEYIRGVTYNKTNESPNNIGYKILRANNITLSSNTLNFDDIKVIKFDTKVKSSQMLYKNDILISAASGSREHVGKVAFIYQDIDYYFGGFMGVIRCNNNVNSRYLFHIFTSSIFQDYLNEVLNSSTINNLNSKVMDSFRLPIPPLSVQTEIVKILDKFENLTNSITEGLPLAIEQSQKRYEYYRELLLNFNNT